MIGIWDILIVKRLKFPLVERSYGKIAQRVSKKSSAKSYNKFKSLNTKRPKLTLLDL